MKVINQIGNKVYNGTNTSRQHGYVQIRDGDVVFCGSIVGAPNTAVKMLRCGPYGRSFGPYGRRGTI